MLSLVLDIIYIIVGVGLIINSLRGLASKEGMYDAESTQIMTWAGWLGGALGVLLLLNGLHIWDIPYVPFI